MYSTVRHDVASKNWQDTEPATEAPEPPSKDQDVATAENATEAPSSDCAAQQYAMLNALIPSFLGSVSSCLLFFDVFCLFSFCSPVARCRLQMASDQHNPARSQSHRQPLHNDQQKSRKQAKVKATQTPQRSKDQKVELQKIREFLALRK